MHRYNDLGSNRPLKGGCYIANDAAGGICFSIVSFTKGPSFEVSVSRIDAVLSRTSIA